MAEFFFIVPVGLEKLAFKELQAKAKIRLGLDLKSEEVRFFKGGLELELNEAKGWACNHFLKIPVRILQRVARFKARDFPQLYKQVQKMNWAPFLRQGPVKIQVSSVSSRLAIKEKIENTVREALDEAERRSPLRKAFLDLPQGLWVKIHQDEVTLSLDTSGDPLYKRGGAHFSHPAPLRENLAAALWFDLFLTDRENLVSADLIDPFCGSGTILLEAMNFNSNRSTPFGFDNFPSSAAKKLKLNLERNPPQFQSAFGYDKNPDFIEGCQSRKMIEKAISVDFRTVDFFSQDLAQHANDFWLISNPPFGLRLQRKTDPLIEALKWSFNLPFCKGLSIVWPKEQLGFWSQDWAWTKLSETRQGGLPIVFAHKKKMS